jgi:hypothetical protein
VDRDQDSFYDFVSINSLAEKTLFEAQGYSWATFASGGAFWNTKYLK